MAKCPKCNKEWEPCYLCRQGEPHQRCVNDSMCHECIMKEKWGEPESANQPPDAVTKRSYSGDPDNNPRKDVDVFHAPML